jgi:hypothetical protein
LACQFIANALKLAWPLPRFEADEYAAAFVAANKQQAGDLRLTPGPEAHGDLEYAYEIRCQGGGLHVRVCRVGYTGRGLQQPVYHQLFDGPLEAAQQFAATSN